MQILFRSEEKFPMKALTTKSKSKLKNIISLVISTALWAVLWGVCAYIVDSEVLLPSPVCTVKRLFVLCRTEFFWRSALYSLLRIVFGFAGGVLAGTLLAVMTAISRSLNSLFSPLGNVIRATPVASFIILALVWLDKSTVPSFIAFLMVTPIVWNALKTAILSTDKELICAARAYDLGVIRTVRAVYFPSVAPQYFASLITSLGLAWKSGIAAEVLCHPDISIGNMLYESKLYLETPDLFAWTATVIILSVIMEKMLSSLLNRVGGKRQ